MSRRSEKRLKREAEDDLRWLIGDVRGRRILRQLLKDNAYATPIFNGNSRDAMVIGRQAAVTEFLNRIRAVDLASVHLMETEAAAAEKFAQQSAEADAGDDDTDD